MRSFVQEGDRPRRCSSASARLKPLLLEFHVPIFFGALARLAYLTESEKRGQWLATGNMDLHPGGKVELHFHHADLSSEACPIPERYCVMENGHDSTGRVIACEPPRLLSITWTEASGEDSEVTFELSPETDDVRLVVTHRRLPKRALMLSVAGGWHAHLGILVDRINGRTPPNFWKEKNDFLADESITARPPPANEVL